MIRRLIATILDKIRWGHLAIWQRKGCLFPFFNVAVMLSRTLTYILTYNIDLGDGGEGRWPYRTDKFLQVNS